MASGSTLGQARTASRRPRARRHASGTAPHAAHRGTVLPLRRRPSRVGPGGGPRAGPGGQGGAEGGQGALGDRPPPEPGAVGGIVGQAQDDVGAGVDGRSDRRVAPPVGDSRGHEAATAAPARPAGGEGGDQGPRPPRPVRAAARARPAPRCPRPARRVAVARGGPEPEAVGRGRRPIRPPRPRRSRVSGGDEGPGRRAPRGDGQRRSAPGWRRARGGRRPYPGALGQPSAHRQRGRCSTTAAGSYRTGPPRSGATRGRRPRRTAARCRNPPRRARRRCGRPSPRRARRRRGCRAPPAPAWPPGRAEIGGPRSGPHTPAVGRPATSGRRGPRAASRK